MKFEEGSGVGAEDGKNYIKLKDGESVKGVFRGAPVTLKKHWINKKPFDCDGDSCQYCAAGDKAGFRFKLNLLMRDQETGQFVARIFEQGWTVYLQLKDLNEEYPLEKTIVNITRRGSGMNDTTYTILPAKEGAVNATLDATLSKIQLFELAPSVAIKTQVAESLEMVRHAPQTTSVGSSFEGEDVPF